MARKLKYKWLIIVLMLAIFYIADFTVINIPVSKRSIAVGLSVDMDGDEVEISTQVILSKQGGSSAGPNNYIVYSAKAKDITGALQKITDNTGRKVSLAHVSSIIIGQDVLQSGNFDYVNYFFKNEIVGDITILVMTRGKGKDLFEAKVPVGEAVSYQIGNVSDISNKPLGKNIITAKKFMENYISGTGENWLPCIELKETTPSDEQAKGDAETADLIVFDGACLLDREGINGFIEDDASDGMSIVYQELSTGVIQIKSREDKDLSIKLHQSKAKIKYDYDAKKIKIKLFMKTTRGENVVSNDTVELKMNEVELSNFQNAVMRKINAAFEQGVDNGFDTFNLRFEFGKRYPKFISEIYEEDFLKNLQIEYDFDIIQR